MTRPDSLAQDLLDLVVEALAIDLSVYQRSTLARLLLYADKPDVELLASLIKQAREQAAKTAIAGTLWA
jgi:hypothetical protein